MWFLGLFPLRKFDLLVFIGGAMDPFDDDKDSKRPDFSGAARPCLTECPLFPRIYAAMRV